MRLEDLFLFACPECGGALEAAESCETRGGRIVSGELACAGCGAGYPISRSVARFVGPSRESGSFGLQWNRFRATQLDSVSGVPISRDRFFRQSGWSPESLSRKRVLDAGCGAGRFAEVVLEAGASVVALDHSSAVDACLENLGSHPNLTVVAGDLYRMPLAPGAFDFVYSFGVLQHTPDPSAAFERLLAPLKAGGRIAIDVYPRLLRNLAWPKYWLRPLTRRLPPERLLSVVEKTVPSLLPASRLLARLPLVGRKARYALPIANYEGILPLSREQHVDWAVLDTFDMLAPTYDKPQSVRAVTGWFVRAGVEEAEVFRQGLVIGRGRKAGACASRS